MRYFQQAGIADMGPLRMALVQKRDLWNRYDYRTTFEGTPFGGMDDILLRYSKPEKFQGLWDPEALIDDESLILYAAWHELPEAHDVVFNLMRRYKGIKLGRVIIARLPMGGRILPHQDNVGRYANREDGMRFHVVVNSSPGCVFHCGDESVQMKTDEVWWFDHRAMHAAENNGSDERIHLLVDIQTG